jgi:hypothetical protein
MGNNSPVCVSDSPASPSRWRKRVSNRRLVSTFPHGGEHGFLEIRVLALAQGGARLLRNSSICVRIREVQEAVSDSRGTVTANTYVQLETKTWAAIQKWHKLCLTARWFRLHDEPAVSPR